MQLDKYLGIPWKRGGRSWEAADCWGIVWLFYKHEMGIELPDYNDAYDETVSSEEIGVIVHESLHNWDRVDSSKFGDVVLLRKGGADCHVGIVTQPNRMIHSLFHESVLVRMDNTTVSNRVRGIYRWKPS